MDVVLCQHLIHSYEEDGSLRRSLDDVSFTVKQGELVALLGHNGCGKSTLARHLNALIPLQSGTLRVAGLDAACKAQVWDIRRHCGMVFQNPDNQFVSSIVEEDLAFGLLNYDVPEEEITPCIREALRLVGMEGFEKRSTHMLSGGQKQRIAIAGVLALNPDILIFDEATSMLDPDGREEVLSTIRRLHREEGKTIIMISHYIEESIFADKVIFIHDGQILAQGTPREMLTDLDLLQRTGLTPPVAVQAYYDLKQQGVTLPFCPLSCQELVEGLCPSR